MNKEELGRKIKDCNKEKPYVFVSYSSKDWERVYPHQTFATKVETSSFVNKEKLKELKEGSASDESKKEKAIQFIKENKTAIDNLMSKTDYQERFKDIEQIYDCIVPIAEKYLVELYVIRDYADYLRKHNKSQKTMQIAKRLERIYTYNPQTADDFDNAWLYNFLGCVSLDQKLYDLSEKYFLSAITIYEKLVQTNSIKYNPCLAQSYNNIRIMYDNQGNMNKSEKYHLLAIKIREKLVCTNPEKYNPDLALSYDNIGVMYDDQGNLAKSKEYKYKAYQIAKNYPENDYCKNIIKSMNKN